MERSFLYVAITLASACHSSTRAELDAGPDIVAPPVAAATTRTTHDGPFTITFVEFRNRDSARLDDQRVVFRVTNGSSLTPAWYEGRFSYFDDAGAIVRIDSSLGCVANCADADAECAKGCRRWPWFDSAQNVAMFGDGFTLRPGETREFAMRASWGPVPEGAVYAEMHFTRAWELVRGDQGSMRPGATVWDATK